MNRAPRPFALAFRLTWTGKVLSFSLLQQVSYVIHYHGAKRASRYSQNPALNRFTCMAQRVSA